MNNVNRHENPHLRLVFFFFQEKHTHTHSNYDSDGISRREGSKHLHSIPAAALHHRALLRRLSNIQWSNLNDGVSLLTDFPSPSFFPSRYRLTRIVADSEAGPSRNHTVVFLGSERGIILKFLAKMNNGFLNDSLFLEELNVYNPDK